MEPSKKNKGFEDLLEQLVGRTTSINNNQCIRKPFGCGRQINFNEEEWNEIEIKEYKISGLCNKCQKGFFG